MNKYLKRIQSKLKRSNIEISLSDIRPVYESEVGTSDIEPTAEQINNVLASFRKTHTIMIPSQQAEIEKLQQDKSKNQSVLYNTPIFEEPEIAVTESTQSDDEQNDIKDMVIYKAGEMGIQIAASEIEIIADQIDTTAGSFTQTLRSIEAALIGYIDRQQQTEAAQVSGMIERVTQRVVDKNVSTTKQLTSGIVDFKQKLEVVEAQQKSQLQTILNRLTVGF